MIDLNEIVEKISAEGVSPTDEWLASREQAAPGDLALRLARWALVDIEAMLYRPDTAHDLRAAIYTRLRHFPALAEACAALRAHLVGPFIDADALPPDQPHPALAHVLRGHRGRITGVAYSLDGQFIVSGSYDHTVRVWESRTGRQVAALHHEDQGTIIVGVGFNADGRQIIGVGRDGSSKYWDSESGLLVRTSREADTAVVNATSADSPDGRFTVRIGADDTLEVWDKSLEALTPPGVMPDPALSGQIVDVAYSPDGRWLAATTEGQAVRLWDAQTRTVAHTVTGYDGAVLSIAYSPARPTARPGEKPADGQHQNMGVTLAASTESGLVKVWTGVPGAGAGQFSRVVQAEGGQDGDERGVYSLSYSPDGKLWAGAGAMNAIFVWESATGQLKRTIRPRGGDVLSIAFSPDGTEIAAGLTSGLVKLYGAQDGAERRTLKGHTDTANRVTYSLDRRTLASCSDDQTVRVWAVETGALLHTLNGPVLPVSGVAFSPDGAYIASADGDGRLHVWESASGTRVARFFTNDDVLNAVVWGADGRQIAVGGGRGLYWLRLVLE